jgi:hypothetical protein
MSNIRPIQCIQTGEIFPNCTVAGYKLGVSESGINGQINGRWNTIKGFTFKEVFITQSPDLIGEYVLRDITFEKYGYYPEHLSKCSRKQIIVKCPDCKTEYSRVRQKYNYGSVCTSCNYIKILRNLAIKKRKPIGSKTIRFQSLYKVAIQENPIHRNYKISHVDYTQEEFRLHIRNELTMGCSICNSPIKGNDFQVSHIIPACFGSSYEDAVLLHSLDNLTVSHPACNRNLRDRIMINKLLPIC